MKKMMFLMFLIFLSFGLNQSVFANDTKIVNVHDINAKINLENEQSSEFSLEDIELYVNNSSYIGFNEISRWATAKYFYLPRSNNYFYIDLHNTSLQPVRYSIANNGNFIDGIVGILTKNEKRTIKINQSKLYNTLKNSNNDPSHLVCIQVTSPGNRVMGSYRIRYGK